MPDGVGYDRQPWLKTRQTVLESSVVLQFVGPGSRAGFAIVTWLAGGGLEAFAFAFVAAETLTFVVAFAITQRVILIGPSAGSPEEMRTMTLYSLPLSLNRALLYSNNQTEIVSGLKPGEPVVTQGAFHLKSILAGSELGEE